MVGRCGVGINDSGPKFYANTTGTSIGKTPLQSARIRHRLPAFGALFLDACARSGFTNSQRLI